MWHLSFFSCGCNRMAQPKQLKGEMFSLKSHSRLQSITDGKSSGTWSSWSQHSKSHAKKEVDACRWGLSSFSLHVHSPGTKEYCHLQWLGLSPSINVIKMMTHSYAQRSISWPNNTNHYSGQVNFQKDVKTAEWKKGSVVNKSPWGNWLSICSRIKLCPYQSHMQKLIQNSLKT